MLAMCVRKPGDSSGGSLQSHVHSPAQTATATATVQLKSRKQKSSGLKVLKRGGKGDAERTTELSYSSQQTITTASRIHPSTSSHSTGAPASSRGVVTTSTPSKTVRDDPEGHLIYTRGDRLEARCELCACVSSLADRQLMPRVCTRSPECIHESLSSDWLAGPLSVCDGNTADQACPL